MSSSANKTNVNDASEIDLSRLVGELIDHRKLIISVTSLFTLIAIIYALFATPIYQADALVQVEQKQANAILSNISQMLPDSQPQSAPEIALLQSRMILGKTVDDLNLQTEIQQNYLPLIGRGIARITGEKSGEVSISHLNMPLSENNDQPIELTLKVLGDNRYLLSGDDFSINGIVGELVDGKAISIKIDKINADVGTEFTIS
ncbi:tyrosine-protein kinase, partial [Escherichia coli]|nr:tyrosine-protein kinase [Escherichia coli]